MSSAGHIFNMISRMKANRAMSKRRDCFRDVEIDSKVASEMYTKEKPEALSKAEMELIRNRIKKKYSPYKRRMALLFILALTFVLWMS